jgi:hypothetical protein
VAHSQYFPLELLDLQDLYRSSDGDDPELRVQQAADFPQRKDKRIIK